MPGNCLLAVAADWNLARLTVLATVPLVRHPTIS
jgi:hypothetical protein